MEKEEEEEAEAEEEEDEGKVQVNAETCRDLHIRDGRPAPRKNRLPRPAKLTKSAGRSGAKLTADSIDTPFHYARD